MKHKLFKIALIVLFSMGQTVFSQNLTVKRVALNDTGKFNIALNSKNTGESLKTLLKIPDKYELRNSIVSKITNQTQSLKNIIHKSLLLIRKEFTV